MDKVSKKRKGRPAGKTSQSSFPVSNGNMIVISLTCLLYVSELTPNSKKGGRKDNGFTIYDSQNVEEEYSFETFKGQIEDWGFSLLIERQDIRQMICSLCGLGPKQVMYELTKIFHRKVLSLKKGEFGEQKILTQNQEQFFDKEYPHLRFVEAVKNKLAPEFRNEHSYMRKKALEIWDSFFIILEQSIGNEWEKVKKNRFEKLILLEKDGEQLPLNFIIDECRTIMKHKAVQTEGDLFKEQKKEKLLKNNNLKNERSLEDSEELFQEDKDRMDNQKWTIRQIAQQEQIQLLKFRLQNLTELLNAGQGKILRDQKTGLANNSDEEGDEHERGKKERSNSLIEVPIPQKRTPIHQNYQK